MACDQCRMLYSSSATQLVKHFECLMMDEWPNKFSNNGRKGPRGPRESSESASAEEGADAKTVLALVKIAWHLAHSGQPKFWV